MNISQGENLTGVTKQNIRFYEKEGLIHPKRNETNGYREYGEYEVQELKLIRVMRKTGMSLEDIKDVLDGSVSLSEAAAMRKHKVEEGRAELWNVIRLCDDLKRETVEQIDADYYLSYIEGEEKKGNQFYRLMEDYKKVAKYEANKEFWFIPDKNIYTPREFTDVLLKYAKDYDKDITITKEGMYPEFILDDIEYSAMRIYGRYGHTVHCEMKYPEREEPKSINEGRKRWMTMLVRFMPLLIWEIVLFFLLNFLWGKEAMTATILSMLFFATVYSIKIFRQL